MAPTVAIAEFGGSLTAQWLYGSSDHSLRSENGSGCSDSGEREFCDDNDGYTATLSLHYTPDGSDYFFNFDGQHLFMGELSRSGGFVGRERHTTYGVYGLHIGRSFERFDGGLFIAYGPDGGSQADSDRYDEFMSVGVEGSFGQYTVLLGSLFSVSGDASGSDESLDTFGYVRVTRDFDLLGGNLATGALASIGDLQYGETVDRAKWFQVSAEYERPIADSRFSFYGSYAFDVLNNSDTNGRETYGAHTFGLGVKVAFGAEKTNAFRTPNFWAPISWAAEAN
ncbi:MAG: hypothetical protein AAGJ34_03765 [Pseudomonadota bacterium]